MRRRENSKRSNYEMLKKKQHEKENGSEKMTKGC